MLQISVLKVSLISNLQLGKETEVIFLATYGDYCVLILQIESLAHNETGCIVLDYNKRQELS